MSKLREFPEWPVEQVMETARMLYALSPFPPNDKSEHKWDVLARQALDFLDKLKAACERVTKQRRQTHDIYRNAEKRSKDADALPDIVPYKKGVRLITGAHSTMRAEPKLERLLRACPRYFFNVNQAHENAVRALKNRWRENGMTRYEVMELQGLFEKKWPDIIAGLQSEKAKKRKKRGAYARKRTGALGALSR
jgi:hypothetical protein